MKPARIGLRRAKRKRAPHPARNFPQACGAVATSGFLSPHYSDRGRARSKMGKANMKLVASATAVTLAFALAACGGDNTADTTTVATTTAVVPAPVAAATPAPAATPSAEATTAPAPTHTPTPAPSASPTATATPVAAASPAMASKPAEFAQCQACHTTEAGKNGIGPSLAHVYGRKSGSLAGYDYSEPMKGAGLTWNAANLDKYLTDPQGVVPGTKMTFAGLKDAAKRKAVIAYLKSL